VPVTEDLTVTLREHALPDRDQASLRRSSRAAAPSSTTNQAAKTSAPGEEPSNVSAGVTLVKAWPAVDGS
jgi:hypothetical protein